MGMLERMKADMKAANEKYAADRAEIKQKHEASKEAISQEWQGAKARFKRRRRMSVVDRLKDVAK